MITSCAWSNLHRQIADKEIAEVYKIFSEEAKLHEITLPPLNYDFVNIKDSFPESKNWVGVCEGTDKIYFDIRWWRLSHRLDREQVVLHEFGHCLLDLDHEKNGIMSESSIPLSEYSKNKKQLIRTMFLKHKENKGKNK